MKSLSTMSALEMEEPLIGLGAKPMSEMTTAELQAHVQRLRELRQNYHSFKAAVEVGRKKPKVKDVEPSTVGDFLV